MKDLSFLKAFDFDADAPRLQDLALPTRKHEEWRFVKLNGLTKTDFQPAPEATLLEPVSDYPEAAGRRVVFINGRFSEQDSDITGLPAGAQVEITSGPTSLAGQRGYQEINPDFFAGLNDTLATTGAHISVDKDQSVEGAIHVVFVSIAGDVAHTTWPRVTVKVGAGSKLTVIEEHVSQGEGEVYLTSPYVDVVVEANAKLTHIKWQRDAHGAFHIARGAAQIEEGADYQAITVHTGALLSRQDQYAHIDGSNTMCALHGLTFMDNGRTSDTHTSMDHVKAHAGSDQVHKCVVGDKAHAVFNGKIFVREQAQQINAFQLNRNLLLSPSARIDTKPQLEILADDVKCSHGATIGQLDEDQLFYLQTRGVDAEAARLMLTYAFAGEVIERVPVLSVRAALERSISQSTGAA